MKIVAKKLIFRVVSESRNTRPYQKPYSVKLVKEVRNSEGKREIKTVLFRCAQLRLRLVGL